MATSYTYPIAPVTGTLTAQQVHLLLNNPRVVAKRVQTLTDQRFIADFLLRGRFNAQGGGIFYETGEQIFAADSPEAITPGGEYPLTVLTTGDIAAAKTVKWGLDTEVYDEAISRLGINPVDRGLTKLANSVVKQVDSVAWGVIASKVTATAAATAAWSTVTAVIQTLLNLQASTANLALGLDLDTVALTGTQYAKIIGLFVSAGVLPREEANPILEGNFPVRLLGYTWVTSPWVSGTDPWVFDTDQLGGMADENIGSPGYARAGGVGVETKVNRLVGEDDRDGYRLRARRVTVPVVLEPNAGIRITGTGL